MTAQALSQILGVGTPLWVSGATIAKYAVVQSPADFQQYVRITATGSGTTDPSADTTNYQPFGGRAIKSIQRGRIIVSDSTNTGQNVTISPVNTSKSALSMVGTGSISATDPSFGHVIGELTTATNIKFSRSASATNGVIISWELVERY